MAVKNPLYGITPSDASRLKRYLGDEYITEARSTPVRESIDAEAGAYFVLAQTARFASVRRLTCRSLNMRGHFYPAQWGHFQRDNPISLTAATPFGHSM